MIFIIQLVDSMFNIYSYILLARIFMSWVEPNPYNPIVRFVRDMTEPVLAPARRIIPNFGMIDLSPLAVFFALGLLRRIVVSILWSLYL